MDSPQLVSSLQNLQGKGIASGPPRALPLVHFHAARIDGVGDVVMVVSRHLDEPTLQPERLEIRVFRADIAERGAVPGLAGDALLDRDGGVAYVDVDLSLDADEERAAALVRVARVKSFWLAGADADARAAYVDNGVADWARSILETELLLTGYLAVQGIPSAFARGGGEDTDEFASWARRWLESREYAVLESPATFAKVLNAAEFERVAGSSTDAAVADVQDSQATSETETDA